MVSDDDLARFAAHCLLPAPLAPRREMRSFGTERGVVTVAGMHHRGVVKTVEDLAFKIIHQGREIFGTVGLAGTPGNRRGREDRGINDPGPSADLIPGTRNCRHCGDPIDGPPLTPSCPGSHSKHLEE